MAGDVGEKAAEAIAYVARAPAVGACCVIPTSTANTCESRSTHQSHSLRMHVGNAR